MPEFIETTVDKFTFRVATDRLYSSAGAWVYWLLPQGGNRVRIGLTDYLQQHSGDMAFVTAKPAGTALHAGDELAELESIKVTFTLASPVSGVIVAVNDALDMNPELVNQHPYDTGWLVEIDATNWEAERPTLLDARAYFALMKAQAQEEAEAP